MNWKKKLTVTGLAGVLIVGSTGCPSDPADTDNEDTPVFEPELESFEVSPSLITSGTDVHGDSVQGEVVLEWEAADAEKIVVFANDSEVDLSDCEPADDDAEDCLDGGSLVHEPEEDTTYRIDVLSDADAECEIDDGEVHNPELCASDSAQVEVLSPALLSLERDEDRFPQDEEFTVEFEVENAQDFEIGIVGDDGELEEICEVDGDGPCTREDAESGELTLSDLDSSITLSGWAENGADDGLGDIAVGEVELTLHPEGAPVIRSFLATPAHVPFGGETTLSWETEDAVEVEIESGFSDIIDTDLSECSDVDADGEGQCDIQFTDQEFEELDAVSFTAVAFSEDDQESAPYEISIVLGNAPEIQEFDVADEEQRALPAEGGDIELTWDIDHDPTHLEITADDETILDTDDDTGIENCESSGDECDLSSDVLVVEGVEEPTTFTLTATSPIGSDNASVNVTVEGAPVIETLTVDGEDAINEPVMVDADTATLAWTTEDTDQTSLERADKPEEGCGSSQVDWSDVDDFGGDPSGDFDIEGLDQAQECFRLTATEDEAGQSSSVSFKIARVPLVTSFEADPSTTTAGEYVTLSWEAPFAHEVVVDSPDTGHINENYLDNCTDVDEDYQGSCDIQISPGSSASSVEFSIYAIGFDDAESDEDSTTVSLGTPPKLVDFCAQAESADSCAPSTSAQDDEEDITLDWELEEDIATQLTITDDQGNVEYESSDPDQSGSITIDAVEQTTTWTLDVSNDFGSDSAEATAFFGPVIEHFQVNGEDVVGQESIEVPTGDIDFDWVTDDTDTVYLDHGEVALDADDCDDVLDWTEIASGAPSDDHLEAAVSQNGCYRITAENPDQTNSLTVFVRTIPFVSDDITTTVDTMDGEDGEQVTILSSVFGAESVTFEARFYDAADDDSPSVEAIDNCTETGMGGDAVDEDVSCVHTMDGEHNCGIVTGCDYDPPEDTEFVGYEICVFDQNADSSCSLIDADDRVEVQW